MVNRPAGGARSKKHERAPQDWYCEAASDAEPLFDALALDPRLTVWDPCCGRGNLLDVAKRRGHDTVGSDIVERVCPLQHSLVSSRHRFFRADFRTLERMPSNAGNPIAIVANPPYGYIPGIAEAFMRRAARLPVESATFIVPIAFLASDGRFDMFTRQIMPSQVFIWSERPTMPPGHMIEKMGPRAFRGGMADYVAICLKPPHRWRTELRWLVPR